MRQPLRSAWLALMAVLFLALAACATDEAQVPLDGTPRDMLEQAVARAEGTLRLRVHASTDADVFVAVEAAEGIVEPDGDSRVTVTRSFELPDGQTADALGRLRALEGTTEVITEGGVTYRTLPEGSEELGGPTLPPGIEWVVEAAGTTISVSDLSAYVATRGTLDLLDEAAQVDDAGPTEIDGTPARWLKAVAPDQGELADTVGPGTAIDVAVDGDGFVRRIAFVPADEQGLRTQVIVDLFDYGVDDTVEPPSEDVVVDREELGDPLSPSP